MSTNNWLMVCGAILVMMYTTLIVRLVDSNRSIQIVEVPVDKIIMVNEVLEIPVVVKRVESSRVVSALWWDDEDLHFLTEALYFEASIETLDCQAQVGYTIMNRVKRRGKSVREIIWAYRQFSYTQDGKHERMTDEPARRRAEAVAKLVLDGFAKDRTQKGEYFYNPSIVDWKFAKHYQVTMECGHHVFLR